jgi:hypothetical protein
VSEQLLQGVQARGRPGYSLARLVPSTKAPLALSGFLALPVFFASLMAASLALERPKAIEWTHNGKLIQRFHDATSSTEAKIWLLSFVPPLLLVAVGFVAGHVPRGLFVVCGAAILDAFALTIRLGRWEHHHTARFPFGEDNYPDSSTSSLISRGQWEHNASNTVHSLVGYTVGLALAAALIAILLEVRRRRGHRSAALPPPIGSELQQTGGAATTSGA